MPRRLLCLLLASLCLGTAQAAFPPSHVVADLQSDQAAVAPGSDCWVAVHLTMEPGYHTYWLNSGDAGLPTRVRWSWPSGVTADALQWPYPQRWGTSEVSYVYEGQTWLLSRVHVPATWPLGTPLPLQADVSWLSCKETCTQGKATLHLFLNVAKSARPSPAAKLVEAAVQHLPQPVSDLQVGAVREGSSIVLTAALARGSVTKATYFPKLPLTIEDSAPQSGHPEDKGYQLELKANSTNPTPVQSLDGVLVLERSGAPPLAASIAVPVAAATNP